MKNSTFKFAMLSLAIVALTGCSKEQSSFNIEDVPGKAKIMGTLAYNAGQGYENGAHTQLIKAAANVRVIALVDNSTILSTATGKTVYETTTDENGNYTIEVPAHYNGEVSVEISADPFFADYSKVVDADNGPVIETENVLFKLESNTVSVTPNDIEINDATFYFNGRNILEAYKYNSTFIVKVGEGHFMKKKDEYNEPYVAKEYVEVGGKDVIVKIDNVLYGATTNGEGIATFIIPSEKKEWSAEAEITVPGYVENEFKFYKNEYDYENYEEVIKTYTLKGIYEQIDRNTTISFNGITGAPAPVTKVRMIFTANAGEDNHGYYWENDMSWAD